RLTEASGIEFATFHDAEIMEGLRSPERYSGSTGQLRELLLPLAQGDLIHVVHIDGRKQGLGALFAQPGIEAMAESAEVGEAAISEREQAVLQTLQRRRSAEHTRDETRNGIGRIAFTGGTHDE